MSLSRSTPFHGGPERPDRPEPGAGVGSVFNSLASPLAAALCFLLICAAPGAAQSPGADRPLLTPDDYGQFETLATSMLSPRGDWLAYGIRTVDEDEELRVVELASDSTRRIPRGRSPVFSPDGRWLVWMIGSDPDDETEDEGRDEAGLLDLSTGEERAWRRVRAVDFDAEGGFLALHGHPPEDTEGRGADLRVVELEEGTVTSFGNVDAFAWSETGSLLAMALATGSEDGNGLQLYHAPDGRLRSLESSDAAYRHLSWREGAADLAVLRSAEPAGADSTAHSLLAWRGLDGPGPERLVLEATPRGIADTLRVVGLRGPQWSSDGRHLSLGLRPWRPEAGEEDPEEEDGAVDGEVEEPTLADVQLWHSADVLIFPQQQSRAENLARATLLAVWSPGEGRIVQVGTALDRDAILTEDWRFGIERDSDPYPWGTMFGRPYHDLWVTEVATGARRKALEEVRYSWVSPGGRFLLSFDGEDYWTHDLDSGAEARITQGLPAGFANLEYDIPTDLLPPYGVGGWLEGDQAVLLYDRHDLWRVTPDGGGGERLTAGAGDEVTHRVVRTGAEPPSGAFRPDEPLFLSLREEPTERRGFARIPAGGLGSGSRTGGEGSGGTLSAAVAERLILEDAWPRGLVRADSAEVYLFRTEARARSPELHLAGAGLADARRVARTNPFRDDYAWTRAELMHFESEAGVPLKGVLLYPADHDPSRTYPMIVYTYEQLSGGIHSFQVPSQRSYYNFTVWTQEGYFVLLPDIIYRARDPGVSALEAVRPAVGQVVDRGLVDPDRVGLIGHSWGGYQATYLPTRTNMFAASVAGAPLTDFKSFMGQIHWSGGNPEVTHWETGQARMEVPYWEDVEAHLRNSPAHFVHEMDTPLLMAFGDDDGVVEWWQGTLFYNFARRAGKEMVLVVYEGEGHSFTREPNQIDYHRRILEWFGHYLKGDPPPAWITDGIPYEALEVERRRIQPTDAPTGGGTGGA
jgi:acetyl esterase/lipase